MDISETDIECSFTYHTPTDAQVPKYKALREKSKELALLILELCPASSQRDRAIIKVEESVMWANKSIACNQDVPTALGEMANGD